jgi:hypothetical protein
MSQLADELMLALQKRFGRNLSASDNVAYFIKNYICKHVESLIDVQVELQQRDVSFNDTVFGQQVTDRLRITMMPKIHCDYFDICFRNMRPYADLLIGQEQGVVPVRGLPTSIVGPGPNGWGQVT